MLNLVQIVMTVPKKGVKFNQFSRQEEGSKKEWTVVFGSQ